MTAAVDVLIPTCRRPAVTALPPTQVLPHLSFPLCRGLSYSCESAARRAGKGG